jgi:hypothetical protein
MYTSGGVSARHLSSQSTCELYLSRHFFVTCLLILVVYIISLCSSINTTTFCFLHVYSDLDPTRFYDVPVNQSVPTEANRGLTSYMMSSFEIICQHPEGSAMFHNLS